MKATKQSFEEAKASLACEGLSLTPEEDAFIGNLIDQGIDSDEGARRIIDWSTQQRMKKTVAAE